MPNIKSAVKRVRIAERQSLRNTSMKSALRTTIKKYETSVSKKDAEAARETLLVATRAIDKAVTKGILHKNTAARKKSRLTKRLNNLANNA
ncbi:30S ribosomal protein S20 [Alicyclobacillus dauci]|uniref:Small ribosomal subunit protein bS20 n=1 Tax=Alicyclobacillus dauci TaxID=1475485 RepID=A0ABY6Z7F6_9BACL|nr:30S ribosomal protein S20 [Alicyclobacillus dauci]WAH38527.1 30S ribosomal protein S20 [Alicyclobacillus dauci]